MMPMRRLPEQRRVGMTLTTLTLRGS